MTVNMLANVDTPVVGQAWVSEGTRTFLGEVSGSLEKSNVEMARSLLGSNSTYSQNDSKFVHREQTMVQGHLNNLRAASPERYNAVVGEINGLLNPSGVDAAAAGAADGPYMQVLDQVREQLGGTIDFANQSHREAIGNALIKTIRDNMDSAKEKVTWTGSRIKRDSC